MSTIKGVIFDKDGTLFDFAATWEVWAKSFLLRLCEGDQVKAAEIGRAIGFDLTEERFARDSVVIAGTPEEVTKALHPYFAHLTHEDLEAVLNEEAENAPQREAVPLAPLLETLRGRGLQLGVATNDAEQPARAHLDQAGITSFFDFIAGYDSGHGGKPAPGQLLAFAAQTGLAASEVIMVGDSTHDLRAGRAAGMGCVAVLTGLADADDLRPFADVVLRDIGELPEWLATGTGRKT
ncbi:HAD-superfamily hydrolase, subfamily IA, variant 1 family protein [Sulfitobacter noctilucicola]|uniref:phosphoglycolate phosphatase n=1 Tax=Sulfitobacter noctilucicola TaxID=1342301 RepID=A0A7W6M8F6_9RHOB|nr:HAD family hydrolase [Sulfitobacter noctilucicola]KIN64454.1 HAD-superfamily hydrolase, subfamily IA, variant 1 family protein [Sulfitobacter noctilucicola]MBB4174386.1 phosphoglycolate phosphatase [Sulfitobacter noctilucicola]